MRMLPARSTSGSKKCRPEKVVTEILNFHLVDGREYVDSTMKVVGLIR